MKIAQINMIPYGSTGKIMFQIAETARKEGNEVRTFSTVPFDKSPKSITNLPDDHLVFGSFRENQIHYYLGSSLGRNGCFSYQGTRQLITMLEEFQPDIIHLHNLHKFCINLPMLFQYLKKRKIPVVWTLHDCWAFTGQCPHFTMIKCDKWKEGCHHCPQIGVYPKSRIDNSRRMYDLKKQLFTGVENMTLVTPSEWMAELVKQSFLKEYPVKVINNGIDLEVFQPRLSDFRERYGITRDKYILLGVAFGWGERKGLDVFLKLAEDLGNNYQIVLVGTDDRIDALLPHNVISIHKTQDQNELVQIYSAADLLVNPTREENYPTVNMESIACGTPVLTFRTGGSPEILDETCGSVVDCDDMTELEFEIRRICTEHPYSEIACVKKAKSFNKKSKFEEYVKIYEDCTYSAKSAL